VILRWRGRRRREASVHRLSHRTRGRHRSQSGNGACKARGNRFGAGR
jgi:hypothetical protein